jgi:SNF2 family DNA or RNA helicase
MKIKLLPHQAEILESTKGHNRVGYFLEMGTGKTFVSSEKADSFKTDILIICPKSILSMWKNHYEKYYPTYARFDLTKPKEYAEFFKYKRKKKVGFINYDLVFRRVELSSLRDYTLLLDESSLIKNETTKRTKFILNRLHPENVILCSGTVCGGKYEYLWSQLRLLGWNISKKAFWYRFVRYEVDMSQGFPITYVYGYKNVEELKQEIHKYGGRFLKTEDVLTLPNQVFTEIKCETTPEYKRMQKHGIVKLKNGTELVGDTVLTKLLYMRMLCGQYNPKKVEALRDIMRSTEDRLIVFYNFTPELEIIKEVAKTEGKPVSVVNGSEKNLRAYEEHENSVTAIQMQAGSMGLNLQKANKIVYFTPPLSSEQYEQSKKRTHRIGQSRTCFYYNLVCDHSVEEKIYDTLAMRRDYSNKLFEGEYF